MIDELYSARVLALVADMPHAGRLTHPDASVEKTSRLCGSRVVVDVRMEGDRIIDFAQDVRACALGQASAAILGERVIGATVAEVEAARDDLRNMLKTGGPEPQGRFAGLALLAQVKDYPARHASTLLAFEACAEAARSVVASRPATTVA